MRDIDGLEIDPVAQNISENSRCRARAYLKEHPILQNGNLWGNYTEYFTLDGGSSSYLAVYISLGVVGTFAACMACMLTAALVLFYCEKRAASTDELTNKENDEEKLKKRSEIPLKGELCI